MHLDLHTDDQAAEVERLTGLGATFVRHNLDPEDDYVVMTDPRGQRVLRVRGGGPVTRRASANGGSRR